MKNIELQIFDITKNEPLEQIEEDALLSLKYEKKSGYITIEGNSEGLISLAKILLGFAYNDIPEMFELHLDAKREGCFGMLDDDSNDIVIMKK
jgi:hypothetical protein